MTKEKHDKEKTVSDAEGRFTKINLVSQKILILQYDKDTCYSF